MHKSPPAGSIARRLLDWAPPVLFCFALMAAAFGYGVLVGRFHWVPYQQLRAASYTARHFADVLGPEKNRSFIGFVKIPAGKPSPIQPIAGHYPENILFTGGWDQFLEYCPQHGCAAVELTRDGRLVHAYPLWPEEFPRRMTAALPHEALNMGEDLTRKFIIIGFTKVDHGDVIITFDGASDFPYGEGIARLDSNGHVLWYQHSYANHWPTFSGGEIYVPVSGIGIRPNRVRLAPRFEFFQKCGSRYLDDGMQVLDGKGNIRFQASALVGLLRSSYRAALYFEENASPPLEDCDPIHVNYVVPVGNELARHLAHVDPGDLLVSMRNLSGFGIFSRKTGDLLHFYRGSFRYQHSVQPFKDSEVILFDNFGVNDSSAPSRVLLYDLATGNERVVYSNPVGGSFFVPAEGGVSVSPDKERIIVFTTGTGDAYEIRVSDGKVLTRLQNLQAIDRSRTIGRIAPAGNWGAKFLTQSVTYANQQGNL